MQPSRTGFTLIELLVVIGIIAVLAGFWAVGVRDGDRSLALQSGQATVASLLSAVRSQAASEGKTAFLLVAGEASEADRYLRTLAVGMDDDDGSLVITKGEYGLPGGVFLVPPHSPSPGWDPLTSSALAGGVVAGWYRFAITPLGTPGFEGGGQRLVLAPAEATPDGLRWGNPRSVRGLRISRYGAVTLVNEAEGFGN
jgi:prepilin-type N-terminal cleavage/methylation domain-containing protein